MITSKGKFFFGKKFSQQTPSFFSPLPHFLSLSLDNRPIGIGFSLFFFLSFPLPRWKHQGAFWLDRRTFFPPSCLFGRGRERVESVHFLGKLKAYGISRMKGAYLDKPPPPVHQAAWRSGSDVRSGSGKPPQAGTEPCHVLVFLLYKGEHNHECGEEGIGGKRRQEGGRNLTVHLPLSLSPGSTHTPPTTYYVHIRTILLLSEGFFLLLCAGPELLDKRRGERAFPQRRGGCSAAEERLRSLFEKCKKFLKTLFLPVFPLYLRGGSKRCFLFYLL